ncbi:MAG TPA: magnesium transporter CorA family protein [Candidatus Paceibacterota bacterium]|nr:magnesium transporter CorA family protein [Candidatus Paceibacterota bacterium]
MIKIYHKAVREQQLTELADFRVGSLIYVENPTEEELNQLEQRYKADHSLLLDALDLNEVPRLEHEEGITYVFTRFPIRETNRVVTLPLLIAVGGDFVMLVSPKPLPLLERFLTGKADFYTTQKSKLFTQIFSQLNLGYQGFLREMSRDVRSTTVRFERVRNRDIIQFVAFERVLNDFLAALVPTNRILEDILSGKYFKLYEEDHELTQDVRLANGQLIESCKSDLKTIVNFREAYSTIMTNNLNRVIKLFTALTVVLTVPTMIASFYGMNVALPFQNSPMAFWWILWGTIIIAIFILGTFVWKRWL